MALVTGGFPRRLSSPLGLLLAPCALYIALHEVSCGLANLHRATGCPGNSELPTWLFETFLVDSGTASVRLPIRDCLRGIWWSHCTCFSMHLRTNSLQYRIFAQNGAHESENP